MKLEDIAGQKSQRFGVILFYMLTHEVDAAVARQPAVEADRGLDPPLRGHVSSSAVRLVAFACA